VTRYALDHGFHAIMDGIFYADRYETMLAGLHRDHAGLSLDVGWPETLRRHATRPQAAEFGPSQMREWYRPRDLLTAVREQVIPETSTLEQTAARIAAETGLS
jgi:hypothetical protein